MAYLNVNIECASFLASHKHIFSTSTQQQIRYLFNFISELMLKMPIQDITLFGLLLPAIPLKMVAVNFRYTALAGLIRQIHQMARHTGEQSRPHTILYREVRMLETRITYVKFSLFFAGLSFLFNLLAVGSHILSAYSMSAMLFIATLASLSLAILLFLYEISRSTEALSLHIADIRQSEQ